MQEAIEGLRSRCEHVRVLGSYRAALQRLSPGVPDSCIVGALSPRYTPARTWRAQSHQSRWGPCRPQSTSGTDLHPRPATAMGGRVLVLNATYEPINVCTVRRAVVLLLKEKAELLERGRWELHSESSTLARPVVIRLVSYVNVPRDAHRRKITRRAVFARDSWTCQYCGSRSNLTVDHVIPRSKGGSSNWENIVASCAPCNRRKGDRLPRQAGMHPRQVPANAASGDLHPRRQPDDPGGVAAVPAPGGLSRSVAAGEARV